MKITANKSTDSLRFFDDEGQELRIYPTRVTVRPLEPGRMISVVIEVEGVDLDLDVSDDEVT